MVGEGYPRAQRGRRLRWYLGSFAGFALVAAASYLITARTGFANELVLPALGLPYWAVVLWLWSRYGPHIPGLTSTR